MRISEAAALSGVPVSTLRYYERLGLLTADRSINGYRSFDDSHIERLRFIDTATRLGLDLPETRRLLDLTDMGTCTGVKAALQPLLADQIAHVEHEIEALTRLRGQLEHARESVMNCPDSPKRCRSECAFRVLAERTTPRET